MNKKLPTSAEKPLTDKERLSIVRRNLEQTQDYLEEVKKENRKYSRMLNDLDEEIVTLKINIEDSIDYADTLEDKLISIASDYNIDIDVEDLIIDNFKQKFNK